MGDARLAYNYTIQWMYKLLNDKEKLKSFYDTRKYIISNLPEYTESTPYAIRANAIKDAHIAIINSINMAKKTKKHHEVKFKCKKYDYDSVYIPVEIVKEKGFYTKTLGRVSYAEPLPPINHACRLVYDRGEYFLAIPIELNMKKKSAYKVHDPVALDPGVRTFMTYYSPKMCGQIGKGDMGRITRLCYHLDKLQSKMTKVNARKRQRMKKASIKLRKKIQNIIKDIHFRTANFLCQNFGTILIPEFEVKSMTSKLKSKVARSMMTWSHYKFRERLIHKASEYNVKVIICREDYTSKTCTKCGQLNNIGNRKWLKCPSCELEIDRDINGARNILLRALGDTPC